MRRATKISSAAMLYAESHLLKTLKPGLSVSRDPDCRDISVPGFFRFETALQHPQLHRLWQRDILSSSQRH